MWLYVAALVAVDKKDKVAVDVISFSARSEAEAITYADRKCLTRFPKEGWYGQVAVVRRISRDGIEHLFQEALLSLEKERAIDTMS